MESYSLLLGLVAAGMHTTAYILYNIQSKKGQSKPNAATWALWAFLVILNALTYQETSRSFWLAFTYFTSSTACILTFGYVWIIGRLEWPAWRDWLYASLAAIGGIVWLVYHQAAYANLIITGTILLSFEPTYRGVWKNPHKETPLPWWLWTLALVVIAVNAALQHQAWTSYVSPVSLTVAHATVAILCSRQRKHRYDVRQGWRMPTTH